MSNKTASNVMYAILWVFTAVVAVVIIIVTAYNLTHEVAAEKWLKFWNYYLVILFWAGIPLVGLFIIGGFVDLMKLFKMLGQERTDEHDDGFVHTPESQEQESSNSEN